MTVDRRALAGWVALVVAVPVVLGVLAPLAIAHWWPACWMWWGRRHVEAMRVVEATWAAGVLWRMGRIVRGLVHTRATLAAGARTVIAGARVKVHPDRLPWAMTVGLIHPHIALSRGLMDRLPSAALGAVVAHECHHQQHRHPLGLLVLHGISALYWPWPAVSWLASRVEETLEVAADAAAVARTSRLAVAAAFHHVLAEAPPLSPGTAGLASASVEHRLQILAGGSPGVPRLPWQAQLATIGSAVLVLSTLMICG
jgi:Zn-dependent protease with chaperone function